ncbi:MFS transporter [Sphaerisporangium sp. NPDC005289]|uniref:MFS transporter n=1 Tax=Sphaerisporangium sp. NPDC005289 TaxID=3155247 RepID=UPI0033B868EF
MHGVMHANVPLRLARAAAFAVVCLTLASVAHWFAGGSAPEPRALLPGGLVVMAVTAALAGRERSPAAVTGLLLAAQAFLHQALGPADAAPVPLHPHHLDALPHDPGLGVGVGMIVAHTTAALVTGWWLSRGETALWSLLRALGAYAVRRLAALLLLLRREASPGAPAVRFRRPPAVLCSPRERVLRHVVVRRGPPVLPVL